MNRSGREMRQSEEKIIHEQIMNRSGEERTYSVDHEQIRRREDVQCRS
jgi:hypothetical protein